MSHSTTQESKPTISSSAAFWLSLLIVILLVAAINFVRVMSGGHDEGHGDPHKTEAVHENAAGGHH